MKCPLCGHVFDESEAGYLNISISGEVMERMPAQKRIVQTGQTFEFKGLKVCVKHFVDIPKIVSENVIMNAARKRSV